MSLLLFWSAAPYVWAEKQQVKVNGLRSTFPLTFQAQNVQHELAQAAVGRWGSKLNPSTANIANSSRGMIFVLAEIGFTALMYPRKHG